ncbi:hypothetical protein [Desulfovibrio sp. Huiquan2017]|uniref:DUF6946 family protein n=1 Tax=Desulfovibrio sp. Huiquan2017 TaxID=2816861 RepID=UPI001A9308C9|nr:hypothetical protein [Desulfovibrio sp. Huiquan2017]
MHRIFRPTLSPEDWRALLAAPDRHWKNGHSALELALAWENASGWPPEVAALLGSEPALADLDMVLAIPEYAVALPGGGRPSQNDLFVLARNRAGLAAIMVEGKASEAFGPTLGHWLRDASPGKRQRLAHLLKTLGLPGGPPEPVRYQLLHRAASALIEAERFHARAAILLIHSFSPVRQRFDEYADFAALYGVAAKPGRLHPLTTTTPVPLYAGWATGQPAAP